ncbi:MAG TPA: helix-turn-helix domain-containing protein [Solirubrobacteraceae bacterium]|jgi:hypothetical protein|nr:helix-turn-helix domain-containing protein [Solirubrobacteraceae bacterium]
MGITLTSSGADRTELLGLLTRAEVQHLLGDVSDRTVRRLAQHGVIDCVRIGHRTTRYTQRSVLALIDPENGSSAAGQQRSIKTTEEAVEDAFPS